MKTERKVTIEPEPAAGEEPAFSTFLSAASHMPTYSGTELNRGLSGDWRHDTELTFWLAATRIPPSELESAAGEDPASEDED